MQLGTLDIGTKSHFFLAGEYIIGDPCYSIPDEEWDEVLENTGYFGLEYEKGNKSKDWDDGVFHYKGEKCFAFGTADGDGCYEVRLGNKRLGYTPVDAGLIGIIPISVAKPSWTGIYRHRFNRNFIVYRDNQGVFHFGNLIINTR